ncbi:hypothetical protein BDC45DRAFT_574667 [Circinella umbellata]|nr:hypothetical protein BDC45DRAFT_574667 [Circinella umbellata]
MNLRALEERGGKLGDAAAFVTFAPSWVEPLRFPSCQPLGGYGLTIRTTVPSSHHPPFQPQELGTVGSKENLSSVSFDLDSDDEEEGDLSSAFTDDYHKGRRCDYEFDTEDDSRDNSGEDNAKELECIIEGFDVLDSLRTLRKMSFMVDPRTLSETRIFKDARHSVIAHMEVYDEEDYGNTYRRFKLPGVPDTGLDFNASCQGLKLESDLDYGEGAMAISERIFSWCYQVSQESRAETRVSTGGIWLESSAKTGFTAPFLVLVATAKDKHELVTAKYLT